MESKQDIFIRMKIWWIDVLEFLWALLPRTAAGITGGGLAAILVVYLLFNNSAPKWVSFIFILLVILVAAFRVHRDQRRITGAKELELHNLKDEEAQAAKTESTKLTLANNEKMIIHDRDIFSKMNNKVDENKLNAVCYAIDTIRVVESKQLDLLHWLVRFGERIGNEYMIGSLNEAYNDFYVSLNILEGMVSTVFFEIPDPHPERSDFLDDTCVRYALYPELKEYPPDHEKRKIYDQAHKDIKDAVSRILTTYGGFRREVQRVLFV
jgi:hypothetical protein